MAISSLKVAISSLRLAVSSFNVTTSFLRLAVSSLKPSVSSLKVVVSSLKVARAFSKTATFYLTGHFAVRMVLNMRIHRLRAVLGLDKSNTLVLLAQAKAIHNALNANLTLFPALSPPLSTLAEQIDALDAAEQAVSTHTKGTAAVRDAKRDILIASLESIRAQVQVIADASPEQAAIIITAAGMKIASSPAHAKPLLAAKLGKQAGSVRLRANASLLTAGKGSKKTSFNWQYSPDGGKTWISAASTPLATTIVEDLTPLTTYGFRVSVTDSDGPGEWSQAVNLLVQ